MPTQITRDNILGLLVGDDFGNFLRFLKGTNVPVGLEKFQDEISMAWSSLDNPNAENWRFQDALQQLVSGKIITQASMDAINADVEKRKQSASAPVSDRTVRRYDISSVSGDLNSYIRKNMQPIDAEYVIEGDTVKIFGQIPTLLEIK